MTFLICIDFIHINEWVQFNTILMVMWLKKYHIDESHFEANEWCLTIMDEFHSSLFILIRWCSSISVESMDECLLYESALRKDKPRICPVPWYSLFTLCHGFRVSEALLLQQCAHFPCSCRSRNLRKHPGWLAYAKKNLKRDEKLHSNKIWCIKWQFWSADCDFW